MKNEIVIREEDSNLLKILKGAMIQNAINIDDYSTQLGDNFLNDKRIVTLVDCTDITFTKFEKLADVFGLEVEVVLFPKDNADDYDYARLYPSMLRESNGIGKVSANTITPLDEYKTRFGNNDYSQDKRLLNKDGSIMTIADMDKLGIKVNLTIDLGDGKTEVIKLV